MRFAAMAGRRTELRLCAGIGSSSSVTNKARLLVLIFDNKTKPSRGSGLDEE